MAGLFFTGLAATERDNRFCIACHLHDEKFQRLTARASADLAGAHYQRDPAVGCIACHGGADPGMRAAVWAVAGFDTLRFLAGVHTEPTRMRLPLRDTECRQCHTPIMKPAGGNASSAAPPTAGRPERESMSNEAADPAAEGRGQTHYHLVRDHNTVRVRCAGCHASHTTDGDAAGRFISKAAVAPICRECHPEM